MEYYKYINGLFGNVAHFAYRSHGLAVQSIFPYTDHFGRSSGCITKATFKRCYLSLFPSIFIMKEADRNVYQ